MHSEFDESSLLLTGATGRLGKACAIVFPEALRTGSRLLDVRSTESINAYFAEHRVKTLVHMASVASVGGCETDRVGAYDINVNGTQRLIAAAKAHGVERMIYLSTACVFRGDDPEAMADEDTLPYPKHYYGLTKYIAEQASLASAAADFQVTVVRTNFTTMPWEYPRAFTDRFGTYLFAQGVAKGLRDILIERPAAPILHVCGSRKISMYEYARLGGSTQVEPMTMADYKGPPLTINMALTTKYWRSYRIEDSSPDDSRS